ncbi:MAG: hypothetical protein ACLPH3_23520 [Terracidiphilus sp.]
MRDKVIVEFEQCLLRAGAESYDQGMQQFAKLLEFIQRHYDPMRTKEQLGALLDQLPEPSWKERLFIYGGFKYLPQVIHFGLNELSKAADETLPRLPRGRPGPELQTRQKIIAHVGQRHTKGYTLEQAKQSAAREFEVSESTVQRIWDDRGSIGEMDFRSVLKFFADGPGDA